MAASRLPVLYLDPFMDLWARTPRGTLKALFDLLDTKQYAPFKDLYAGSNEPAFIQEAMDDLLAMIERPVWESFGPRTVTANNGPNRAQRRAAERRARSK